MQNDYSQHLWGAFPHTQATRHTIIYSKSGAEYDARAHLIGTKNTLSKQFDTAQFETSGADTAMVVSKNTVSGIHASKRTV